MRTMTENGIVTQSGPLIIVNGKFSECAGVHEIRVHHRDWPELYGEGGTTQEAIKDLLRDLLSESGCVTSNWHRENLERVTAEVQDFLKSASPAEPVV
jgi:hypothetical protein